MKSTRLFDEILLDEKSFIIALKYYIGEEFIDYGVTEFKHPIHNVVFRNR